MEDSRVVSSMARGAKSPDPLSQETRHSSAHSSVVKVFHIYTLAEDAFENDNGRFYSTSKREVNPGSFIS